MRSALLSSPFAEEMENQRGEVPCLGSHSRILEQELQSMAGACDNFYERKLVMEERGWRAGEGHGGLEHSRAKQ